MTKEQIEKYEATTKKIHNVKCFINVLSGKDTSFYIMPQLPNEYKNEVLTYLNNELSDLEDSIKFI